MVSTPWVMSEVATDVLPRKTCSREISENKVNCSFSFALVVVLLTLVTVFVPESPDQLASVCEKHNSSIACQVW